jgi:hypothetical protein
MLSFGSLSRGRERVGERVKREVEIYALAFA